MNDPFYPSRPPTETHILAHLDTLARRQSELSLDGKLCEGLRVWHAESEALLRAAGECVKRDYAAQHAKTRRKSERVEQMVEGPTQ